MHSSSFSFLLQSKLNIGVLHNISQVTRVISLQWYDGRHGTPDPDAPALVICYDNGRVQLMRNESDESEEGGMKNEGGEEIASRRKHLFTQVPSSCFKYPLFLLRPKWLVVVVFGTL